MKQSKLRRRRVIRYAVLYFILFVVFMAIIIGPAVVGKKIMPDLIGMFDKIGDFVLLQPRDLDNNNTNGTSETGTGMPGYSGAGLAASSSGKGSKASTTAKIKLF